METRIQHFLLRRFCLALFLTLASVFTFAADDKKKKGLRVNSELFDIGFVTGVINIEDFTSELFIGANITFKATEDFFLQYNYMEADVGLSSIEVGSGTPFGLGENRSFTHYDLLIGYNVFQGEFFASKGKAHLANLYVVGGFGDTTFGSEENFTYTVGVGYLVEFSRKYIVRVDYRDYIFDSSLIVSDAEATVHNTQLSIGVGYLF